MPSPLTLPLSLRRLRLHERKPTFVARRDPARAGSGDEALERKPFDDQLLSCKPLKRLHLQEARLPITLEDRILKLRSLTVCPGQTAP